MKRSLIICSSHLYVPTTISLILLDKSISYIIYTENSSIAELFNNSELSVSIIEEPKRINFPHVYNNLVYKRKLVKEVQEFKIDRIIFFHDGYCMCANWLIKRLSQSVNIQYCPLYSDNYQLSGILNWRQVYSIITNFILYGILVKPIKGLNNTVTPYLRSSFFDNLVTETIKIPIAEDEIKKNIGLICPSLRDFKNLYMLLQCELVGHSISQTDYEACVNELISRLGVEKFAFKAKPGRDKAYGLEEDCLKIPGYLTASLILGTFNCVIGTSSTVLAEAANRKIKAISLLSVIPSQDLNDRDFAIQYLKNLSDGILFPTSIDEVIKLISNKE